MSRHSWKAILRRSALAGDSDVMSCSGGSGFSESAHRKRFPYSRSTVPAKSSQNVIENGYEYDGEAAFRKCRWRVLTALYQQAMTMLTSRSIDSWNARSKPGVSPAAAA